ncbi:MAG TPA: SURF1 family protein [Pseudomonas sp.]|nr:SURF1 family protein [Pseudomonas sp.]
MRAFRPGLLPTLLVLLLLALLLALGAWQLQRADEKSALLVRQEARRQAPAQPIGELERSADPAFQRVVLRGYFDAEHSLLLDNRSRAGRVGVELLQPFYDQPSGLWLLLNRGWLPWPDRRTPVAFSTPTGALQLQAWIYVAPGQSFQLQADAPGKAWPQLLTRVDAGALWRQLGRAGWPYELRLLPGPAAYQADWAVLAMVPEKHLGYAVQWFALAVALVCWFIYFGMRNAREPSDAASQSG